MLFYSVVYLTMIVTLLIIGYALFRLSRGININITVTHKPMLPKAPLSDSNKGTETADSKEEAPIWWHTWPSSLAVQAQLDPEQLLEQTKNANKPIDSYTTPISMDGVISEVNKVMGIEPIEQDERKENK